MTCEGRLVADHERCWARHQTISDPAQLAVMRMLREHDEKTAAAATIAQPPGAA